MFWGHVDRLQSWVRLSIINLHFFQLTLSNLLTSLVMKLLIWPPEVSFKDVLLSFNIWNGSRWTQDYVMHEIWNMSLASNIINHCVQWLGSHVCPYPNISFAQVPKIPSKYVDIVTPMHILTIWENGLKWPLDDLWSQFSFFFFFSPFLVACVLLPKLLPTCHENPLVYRGIVNNFCWG